MRATDIVKSAFRPVTPADVADAADTRMQARSMGLRNPADGCGYLTNDGSVRKVPQPSASFETRMDAGDPQHPQVPQPACGGNAYASVHPPCCTARQTCHAHDPADTLLACLSHLRTHGVVLALEHGQIVARGLEQGDPVTPDAGAVLLATRFAELLAALRAQHTATEVITKAAQRDCWDCQHLRTLNDEPGNKLPQCKRGHPLVWRRIGPGGVRTAPTRFDMRACPDKDP